MMEEHPLPQLPAVSSDAHSHGIFPNPRKRVRPPVTNDAPPVTTNSSDPAIFSSDDDPALDNYVEGRRKKRYVGSWFQQHPASSDSAFGESIDVPLDVPKKRRVWARTADSGVFFGSDGNESDDMPDQPETPPSPKLLQLDREPARPSASLEQAMLEYIETCLEHGTEAVDFGSLGLECISSEILQPLSQLSCIPVVTKDVAFVQKEPELKLYLGMNKLFRVPGAVFDFTHLTILSLRNNKLTELPPSIAKLHNLQDLNISQNRLRSLPVELLKLFESDSKLERLVLHPNPFFRSEDGAESKRPERAATLLSSIMFYGDYKKPRNLPSLISKPLGRSPVQLSTSMGRILSEFRFPADPADRVLPMVKTLVMFDRSNPSSAGVSTLRSPRAACLDNSTVTPSLVEATLRACYRSERLPEMIDLLPESLSHLRELLERASRQKEVGGLTCSRCERLHVVSTVEWIEWRQIGTCQWSNNLSGLRSIPMGVPEGEVEVPFLHRGCSWRCGPREVKNGSWVMPKGYPKPSSTIPRD